jgi:serine/threonine protein kinase
MNLESLAAHKGSAVVDETQARTGFASGTLLRGTYQILHSLGVGGMGEVYAASHTRLPGLFAIKALHKEHAHNEHAVLRFRCEAEIMAALRHPNIVQVFDFNVADDGTPYMAMEFIEGSNLGERLRAGERFSPERVAKMVLQIAKALDAAHRHGVVHRDLKPENVMLTCPEGQDDHVKVVDFGISKALGSSRITSEKTLIGTPQFMAPEQAQGRHDHVDARTDQFALAAMTYTLLAGCEPFLGDTPVSVLYQVVHEEPKPLGTWVDWSCGHVDAVLRKAMAKHSEDRYPAVIDFANALVAAVEKDLKPGAALVVVPPMESFVSPLAAANSITKVTVELPDAVQETMVIDRHRRVLAAPLAAVGLAAAALLAFIQLGGGSWQSIRAAFAPPHTAASTATIAKPGLPAGERGLSLSMD